MALSKPTTFGCKMHSKPTWAPYICANNLADDYSKALALPYEKQEHKLAEQRMDDKTKVVLVEVSECQPMKRQEEGMRLTQFQWEKGDKNKVTVSWSRLDDVDDHTKREQQIPAVIIDEHGMTVMICKHEFPDVILIKVRRIKIVLMEQEVKREERLTFDANKDTSEAFDMILALRFSSGL